MASLGIRILLTRQGSDGCRILKPNASRGVLLLRGTFVSVRTGELRHIGKTGLVGILSAR
jgi:hypothetical protein